VGGVNDDLDATRAELREVQRQAETATGEELFLLQVRAQQLAERARFLEHQNADGNGASFPVTGEETP
jgi:hypothetical protein